MGKKDKKKKKDPEKKAELQAKKDAKAEKTALKRFEKEAKKGQDDQNQDESLDEMLSSYAQRDKQLSTPVIEPMKRFPSARANFSLTLLPNNDLIMFGGEYFNGAENLVFDDLYLWNPDGLQWKQIFCPTPRPAPRCAHSAALYRDSIYIFGGEMATTDQFHHYRDFWCFDIKTRTWTEIKPLNPGPTARSGHRCLVWRNCMILLGGFYEAMRETPRWFNDLWVYNFASNMWKECNFSKLATVPDARSGFVFGLHLPDTAFLHGGFSKIRNPGDLSEGKIHTDAWSLNLKPLESGDDALPVWNRLTRKGEYPSPRVSVSGVSYKHRLLVFGGVLDEEQEHHTITSIFYNDLFALDMEKRRWFTLGLKAKKDPQKKLRRRKPKDKAHDDDQKVRSSEYDEQVHDLTDDSDSDTAEAKGGEVKSSGWNLEMLQSNMSTFVDGQGNLVCEKIKSTSKTLLKSDIDDGYDADEGGEPSANEEQANPNDSILSKPFSPADTPIAVGMKHTSPLPRIKPALVVRNGILYVYGGIVEVGDREVTLDDVWTLDISKREQWECLYEGTMSQQVWKGVTSDDEDSYISTGANPDEDDDEDDDEDVDDTESEEEGKKESEIDRLYIELKNQVGHDELVPEIGESLTEFYARTNAKWSIHVSNKDEMTEKELKKAGFTLARECYEKAQPILKEIELKSGSKDKNSKAKQVENEAKSKSKESISVSKDRRKNRAK